MDPPSLGVSSILKTRMGSESLRRQNQELLAYCWSINFPVAPQSTKALVDLTSAVSVVSGSTFSLRELVLPSVAPMMNLDGSHLSHLGQDLGQSRNVGVGDRDGSGSCMTLSVVSIVSLDLIDKTSKQFGWQNPAPLAYPPPL